MRFRTQIVYLVGNVLSIVLWLIVAILETITIVPIGFVIGILTNRFPEWARWPISNWINRRIPNDPFNDAPLSGRGKRNN